MTTTYDCIATTTLGSAQATVTFSSISGVFTDLVLIVQGGTTNLSSDWGFRFNGDTGTNYSRTVLWGGGGNPGSNRSANQDFTQLNYYGYPDNNFNLNAVIHFMNYSSTTTNKTIIGRCNNGSAGIDMGVGLWRSTSAITSIQILFNTGQVWRTGSIFSLYGIKAE